MNIHLLAVYVVAVFLAMIAPGPDMMFILATGARGGPRAGLLATLGVASSEVVQITAVAVGLSALFAAAPAAFTVLRLCGAAYLLYLGIQALRSARRVSTASVSEVRSTCPPPSPIEPSISTKPRPDRARKSREGSSGSFPLPATTPTSRDTGFPNFEFRFFGFPDFRLSAPRRTAPDSVARSVEARSGSPLSRPEPRPPSPPKC